MNNLMSSYPTFEDTFPELQDWLDAYKRYPLSVYDTIPEASLTHIYFHLFLNHGTERFKTKDVRKCEFIVIDFLNHNYWVYRTKEAMQNKIVTATDEDLLSGGYHTMSSMQNPDNDDVSPTDDTLPFTSQKSITSNTRSKVNAFTDAKQSISYNLDTRFYQLLCKQCFLEFYIGDVGGVWLDENV